jgi:hypothetical protein
MTSRPLTCVADLANLPPALAHLTKLERWVLWRWELRRRRNGQEAWTKPPYQCAYPNMPAKSNDPSTWGTYEAAVAAVAAGLADGIGFVLKGSEVAAGDLDHVRNMQTGELLDWAQKLCAEADQLGLYREVTVSGCGLRFIGLAPKGNELHRKFTFDRKSGAGIELYRNCARYITISGLQEGTCKKLGSIDGYLDELVTRYDGQAAPQTPAPVVLVNAFFDFNTAGPQTDYYRDLIENGAPEGERNEKFQEVVWHLAAMGWSIEQIVDELSRFPNGIGLKYAGRLLAEVTRSFNKWLNHRRASVAGSAPGAVAIAAAGGRLWPQIQVVPGELPRVVNEAEDALLLLGREIYQRDGMLVRPVLNKSLKASDGRKTASWQLIEVKRPYLVEQLCCAAQFQRYDKRSKGFVPTDAPNKVAEAYLSRQGSWKLPHLAGVVNTPFLRVDGSICETPGYDPASYVLFKPEAQIFPSVPQYPSKADARDALEELRKLIGTFPFVAAADRSVALAAKLTALDRRSMRVAPLFGFTAPMTRTGKSLLVDVVSILATGRAMPVKSQGRNEEEFEKRLGGSLLAADLCISIDNCSRPLSGDMLCQALTQDEVDVRVLGHNRNIKTATIATIFANGNNLVVEGDLTGRSLLCSLDAKVERPELRKFNVDVIETAHARRGELVICALTVLRAWHVARQKGERVNIGSFGGFEDWSRRVREVLIWLGEADPYDTVNKLRANDPAREALVAVLLQWRDHLGIGAPCTVQEVIARAVNVPEFYIALMNVAASKSGGSVNNDRLGRWLKRVEGEINNGLRLVCAGIRSGYPIWSLHS